LLPRFYPILDTGVLTDCDIERAAAEMLEGGARILQLRHKGHFSRALFDSAGRIRGRCREAGASFIVNDRADMAALLDAGVHLGQDDLPPVDARKIIGSRLLGFSTHNAAQLWQAAAEPIDYVALGPIFATDSKANPDPVIGLSGLRELRPLTIRPLVAIGGITLDRAREVLEAGADSIAVISDVCRARDVRARVVEWLKQLG
jgi:thiamine-phosphate pyrophosphorylase